jgi:branched-chain amino acid transport system permease protein
MALIALRRDRPEGRSGLLVGMLGPVVVAGLVTLLAWLVVQVTGASTSGIVILFGINAVMVVGFQCFVGNTGIVSFGHVAFMGLGAYAAGIVSVPVTMKSIFLPSLPHFLGQTELPTFWTLLIGGSVAAVVAFVMGLAIMRLSGAAASIATLGLLVIVNNVLSQAHAITRGPQSFFGVPRDATFEWVFGSLIAVVVVSAWLKWSALGLRARSVRDDPIAAEASGVRRLPARLWPFVVSAFITGVGGALYAQDLTAFSPDSFFVSQIVGVLVMAIIGGLSSISGALVGAAIISVLAELLRRIEAGFSIGPIEVQSAVGISEAVFGVALILMLRWRPAGVLGALELEVDPRLGRIKKGVP